MADRWPRKVRVGAAAVTVYRSRYGGKLRYRAMWREAGETKMRGASSERHALEFAREQARALDAGGGTECLDRADAQEWREAHRIATAEGRSVLGAIREWRALVARRGLRPSRQATIEELAPELASARRQDGATEIYVARLRRELLRLARDLGDRTIDTITTDELEDWLRSRGVGPRRRQNLRATMVTLWRYAKRRGALPEGETAADGLERIRTRIPKVRIYTPDQARRLFAASPPALVPWLATCAFAGVRSDGEIRRLRWEDIRWDSALIDVTESKTGRRRLVPIQPNLAEWLAPRRGDTGPIVPWGRVDHQIPELARAAGVEWIRNGLRHSFGSYRCAVIADVPRVAYEMGNSPDVVKAHYLERVPESLGHEWFSIRPGSDA